MHQQRQVITDQHNLHHMADIILMIDNLLNVFLYRNAAAKRKKQTNNGEHKKESISIDFYHLQHGDESGM